MKFQVKQNSLSQISFKKRNLKDVWMCNNKIHFHIIISFKNNNNKTPKKSDARMTTSFLKPDPNT